MTTSIPTQIALTPMTYVSQTQPEGHTSWANSGWGGVNVRAQQSVQEPAPRQQGGMQSLLQMLEGTMERLLKPLADHMQTATAAANAAPAAPAAPQPAADPKTAQEQAAVAARINDISGRWEHGAQDRGGWNDRERNAIETTKANAIAAVKHMTHDQAMATLNEAEAKGWGQNAGRFEDGSWRGSNDFLAGKAAEQKAGYDQRLQAWNSANQARQEQAAQRTTLANTATQSYTQAVVEMFRSISSTLASLAQGGGLGGPQQAVVPRRPSPALDVSVGIDGDQFAPQQQQAWPQPLAWQPNHVHSFGNRPARLNVGVDVATNPVPVLTRPQSLNVDVSVGRSTRPVHVAVAFQPHGSFNG